jgi:hypothetical protein
MMRKGEQFTYTSTTNNNTISAGNIIDSLSPKRWDMLLLSYSDMYEALQQLCTNPILDVRIQEKMS